MGIIFGMAKGKAKIFVRFRTFSFFAGGGEKKPHQGMVRRMAMLSYYFLLILKIMLRVLRMTLSHLADIVAKSTSSTFIFGLIKSVVH